MVIKKSPCSVRHTSLETPFSHYQLKINTLKRKGYEGLSPNHPFSLGFLPSPFVSTRSFMVRWKINVHRSPKWINKHGGLLQVMFLAFLGVIIDFQPVSLQTPTKKTHPKQERNSSSNFLRFPGVDDQKTNNSLLRGSGYLVTGYM